MKELVIVVVNNHNQFAAIIASDEFKFVRKPKCIVANDRWCCEKLRGLENFTIIFGDEWAKNLRHEWLQEFRHVLSTRREVEELHSRL